MTHSGGRVRHVRAGIAPASSIAAIRTVAVTLPRLRCLERAVPPDESAEARPVWRGPPKSIDPVAMPAGSRVSPLTAAMRAAVVVRAELPPAPPCVAPEPDPEPVEPSHAPAPIAQRRAETTVGEFHLSRRFAVARDAVCHAAGLDPDALMAAATNSRQVRARQVVYWLLTDLAGLSTTRAGQLVRRDHSAVIHGRDVIRAVVARGGVTYDEDTRLCDLVAAILEAAR